MLRLRGTRKFQHVIEAQDLAVADSFSRSSDPYCIVALAQRDASGALGSAQRVHKTKTVKKTLSPVWNETVRVQAVRPDTTVCIEVWDWDRFKRDDFLGSTSLALQGYVAKGMVDEWLLLFDKQMRPASGRLHVQIECTPYTPGGAAAAIAAASPWADAPRAVVLKRRVFAKWVERTLRHPLLSSSSSSSSSAAGSDVIDAWSPAWFFELLSALVPLPLRSADATAAASVAGTPTNDSAMRLFRALCGIPAQFVLDPANLGSAQDHGSFTLRVLWECFNRLAKPERTCPDSTEEQVLRWFRDAAQLSKVAVFPKCLADGSVLTAALRSVGKLPSPAPVGLPAVLASLGPAIGLEHYLTAEELLDLDAQGAAVWLHHVFALCKPPPPLPLSPREPAPPVAATAVEQQQAPQVAPAPPPAAAEANPTAAVQPTDPAEQFVCAARDGQTHIVRKLLPNADVNWVFDSKTALHHAAWNGNSSMVELLVRAGADTEIPNRFGSTAILLAAANGHLGVVQFLAENGAKVDRPGQNGWTAEIAARNQGHPEVAEFLSGLRSATRPIGASSSSISPSPQPAALVPPTPPPAAATAPAPAQVSAPEGEPHIDAFVDASEIQPPPAPTTMPSGAPVENPETCAQQ